MVSLLFVGASVRYQFILTAFVAPVLLELTFILLLELYQFCGVIVLVNILIAIVTGEYEKAKQRSCFLFARARLEAAARHGEYLKYS